MKRFFSILIFTISIFILISCEEKSDPALDAATFTKIYSNNQFSTAFYPLSIKQTADEGYLILGEKKLYDSTARYTYLLKVDKFGNVVKDTEADLDKSFTNPAPNLIQIDKNYYFFFMIGTGTYLAKTDADLTKIDTVEVSGLTYPAAASFDQYDNTNSKFTLLNYDYDNRQFLLSVVDVSGQVSNTKRFDIETTNEIEGPIIDHFNHTGKEFPFLTGRLANGTYYFNAFVNYSFSLIFTDLSDDNAILGRIDGQRNYGGINSIVQTSTNDFAASKFNFGSNYFLPKITISTTASKSITDYDGNPIPELVSDSKVKTILATANAKSILLYAANTRSNQIGLYAYDATTGLFIGSKYLGFSNPFEVADIIQTSDGGIAVCGKTYTAGRFSRLCIFKLSKSELSKFTKS
ncbi:MAG TPA: hypothetical protein VIM65_19775 [Cyclobacteriaceae bacterium]